MNLLSKEQQKAWDKVITNIFLSKKNASFLSSILTSATIKWFTNEEDKEYIAYVEGLDLHINRDRFFEFDSSDQLFIVLHEIWHIARLHAIRKEERIAELWNMACDYVINTSLLSNNYIPSQKLINLGILINKDYKDLSEEEIYIKLKSLNQKPNKNNGLYSDLKDSLDGLPKEEQQKQTSKIINAVAKASQQVSINNSGEIPGGIKENLHKFLKPVVNWRTLLERFIEDLSDDYELTWSKPNRRFEHVYLPGHTKEENKLGHIMFFLDTSGSITKNQAERFNSEIKYIFETFKPEKLTVVQFDYVIQNKKVFTEDQPFTNIDIIGRGGTSLIPVRNEIIKEKPQAAVIFSDLYVHPMEKLPFKVPIIWICSSEDITTVPFGKLIHIPEN